MFNIELSNKEEKLENSTTENISQNLKEHKEPYDLIMIGAGGAAYTAAIYSARYNQKTLVIGEELGGQMAIDYEVENYPGFRKIIGRDLMKKFEEHAKDLGAEIKLDKVQNIEKLDSKIFKITTMFSIYYARSVVLALGTKRRKLNIPGEEKYVAKGVSYCATCDGAFYKDKIVAVIGGGDSAFASAFILLQHAKKVYIIHRRDEFRAKPGVVKEIKTHPNVEFIMNANVTEVLGNNKVEKIKTDNEKIPELEVDGIFIDIGTIPATSLAKDMNVETDPQGYIKVKPDQSTNIKGVYAAGDITTESNKVKQLITAVAEGGIAAGSAFEYIRKIQNSCKNNSPDCTEAMKAYWEKTKANE